MRFLELKLPGVFLLEPELRRDERGFFSRTWCHREARDHGIDCEWVQCNTSFNRSAGTLRGLHYQEAPYGEAKLVRCTRGAIHDVVVDLRPSSMTYGQWLAVPLSVDNQCSLYIPAGMAHGFQTLTDDCEVFYQMSAYYRAEAARGVRWNDPTLAIVWPECAQRLISERDRSYRDLA
jgi:dTDP-4-dehydrorhamnose 3,5-epimerase